jgi:hypothetical protein
MAKSLTRITVQFRSFDRPPVAMKHQTSPRNLKASLAVWTLPIRIFTATRFLRFAALLASLAISIAPELKG